MQINQHVYEKMVPGCFCSQVMTSVPANWALHTTCIASDFVQQLFDHNVAGDQRSILPPLEIDVPTMLACQQLARVLADAYANPSKSLLLQFSRCYLDQM